MTLHERSRRGAAVIAQKAAIRAELVRRLLEEGEHLKRAAWKAGVSHRTARRYRQRWK
jgi:hypothetical protein